MGCFALQFGTLNCSVCSFILLGNTTVGTLLIYFVFSLTDFSAKDVFSFHSSSLMLLILLGYQTVTGFVVRQFGTGMWKTATKPQGHLGPVLKCIVTFLLVLLWLEFYLLNPELLWLYPLIFEQPRYKSMTADVLVSM